MIVADGVALNSPVHWMVAGDAAGATVALDEPLSFWGGFDPDTGQIVDGHHPQVGRRLTGRIVVMRAGRGSSSSSSVIAEAIRRGSAPAAVVLAEVDQIIAVGAIVAHELYGLVMPVAVVDEAGHRLLVASRRVELTAPRSEAGG